MMAVGALGVALFASLAPAPSGASSHREAPLVAADPQIDNTDVYAFVSPNRPSTVTLIASFFPFEEPAGGPNFYSFSPNALYDIRIDNNGDAVGDVTYRFKFTNHYRNTDTFLYNTGPVNNLTDSTLNFYQTYDLIRITSSKTQTLVNDAVVLPSRVGDASMPDYGSLESQATIGFDKATSKAFAGQSDDPFFLDLRVFDLLYGGNLSETGDDTLAGFNVQTLAIQVPKTSIAIGGNPGSNPIVGIWSTVLRQTTRVQTGSSCGTACSTAATAGTQTYSGSYVVISRLGMPLVNEVVIPLKDKDNWNASVPSKDAQFLEYVNDPELPHLMNAVYGFQVPDSQPNTPGIQRDDLISVFLTGLAGLNQPANVTPSEELRLNMSIAPCEAGCSTHSDLGVIGGDNAGFPNGRRLTDDIIDAALRVTEGVLLPSHDPRADTLGDGVSRNDVSFQDHFPYVALSHSGSDPNPHVVRRV